MSSFITTDQPQNIADGIVFYYSPNCPYCKTVLPKVNTLHNFVAPGTELFAVNVQGMPSNYGLNTVPALEYKKDGKTVSRVNESGLFEEYINRLCLTSRNNYLFC